MKRIAEFHSGSVSAASENEVTFFSVKLPKRKDESKK